MSNGCINYDRIPFEFRRAKRPQQKQQFMYSNKRSGEYHDYNDENNNIIYRDEQKRSYMSPSSNATVFQPNHIYMCSQAAAAAASKNRYSSGSYNNKNGIYQQEWDDFGDYGSSSMQRGLNVNEEQVEEREEEEGATATVWRGSACNCINIASCSQDNLNEFLHSKDCKFFIKEKPQQQTHLNYYQIMQEYQQTPLPNYVSLKSFSHSDYNITKANNSNLV